MEQPYYNQVLELIKTSKNGVKFIEIKKFLNKNKFNITPKELDNFLRSLINEGKIYYNFKKELYFEKDLDVYIGEFKETRHSYSFVEVSPETDNVNKSGNALNNKELVSFFCPDKFSMNALNGDIVKFKLLSSLDKNGQEKTVAKVIRILKRNGSNILGEIQLDDFDIPTFIPIDFINQKHTYSITNDVKLTEGNFVVAKFIDYKNFTILIEIIEILFDNFTPEYDNILTLKKYNKDLDFSNEIKELNINTFLKTFKPDKISDSNRVDLTNELIYTIDGISSKDLDDAVSVFENPDSYTLKVHIADVSYYVKENSLLDIEARKRANSIYLIDYVSPMLPKFLSNELCSLNPGEVKNVFTAEMIIDKITGEIKNSKFYKAKIISKYRLTYEEVDKFFENSLSFDKPLEDSLILAQKISLLLRKQKISLGMIDFVLPEIKIDIDELGNPIKIYDKYQTNSEKIIEDLMVAANESVAKYLTTKSISAIFRVHPKPNLEKLEELRIFAKTIYREDQFPNANDWTNITSFINTPSNLITSKILSKYIHSIEDLENNTFLKVNLIQTMEKARYEINNSGHYALGLEYYLHFTSPIRRYADLIVHRMLANSIFSSKPDHTIFQTDSDFKTLNLIAENISELEKETMQIERSLKDIKKARYLKKLMETTSTFDGKIVNILSFGFFVDVNEQFLGLVRYKNFTDEVEPTENKLKIHNKTKKTFLNLFDKVKVNILEINLIHGTIDMELIDESNSKE